jgi:predicted DNA-binding transcriptional regulator AlpA
MSSTISEPAQAVLSYVQAARYLGLPSVGALRTMVWRGRAPKTISFGRGDKRFRRVDIDAWIAERAAIADAEAACHRAPPPPPRRGRPTKAEAIARRRGLRPTRPPL